MTQRSSTYIMAGGLDETTQPLAFPKGRARGCLNYESISTGYGRVQGYERYNGRLSPSAAFRSASAGQEVAAREAARSAITPVPGSGPVRGVAVFAGVIYAWRDNVAATACVMYRSSASGWASVPLGASADYTAGSADIPAGATVTGATSGATATVKRSVMTGGSLSASTAAGYLVLSGVVGTFQAGEKLKVGSNANVATLTAPPVGQGFPPGGRYCTVNNNFYGAPNLRELYGCNGVGRAFAFNGDSVVFIRTGMVADRPNRVAVFKRHLFLSFPGGSVQNSGTGEPLKWAPILGAGEIGVGSDVTDFVTGIDALHILTLDQINTLVGNDVQDFQLQPLNNEEGQGGVAFTGQTLGSPVYLDVGGFRAITTTQAYGNFRMGTVVPQVQPSIASKRRQAVQPSASVVVKGKDQYRAFYADGFGISIYFGRKYPEPMLFSLPISVFCTCTELNLATGERAFAGATNGYVYQLDSGTSFDGAAINAFLRLGWDNEGSADVLKRWHKIRLEVDAVPEANIGILGEFDYANEEQSSLPQQNFAIVGGGGFWDSVDWDDFYWSAPAEGRAEAFIDGQGENMSILIVSNSAEEEGHVIKAVRKMFTIRGQLR